MSNNKHLIRAKKVKNDEYYTQLEDIEKELSHYTHHFKDKVIYCNCDNPEWSNFWQFFYSNFKKIGLKKLISTHYDPEGTPYIKEFSGKTKITPLSQKGDFRSPECVEILKHADIIVTNPPFSLFREYIALLQEHHKQFLVIGPLNAATCKDIFPLIQSKEIQIGHNMVKVFSQPDGSEAGIGNVFWFTNLKTERAYEPLNLTAEYNSENYPKYDNFDAINVDALKDIPRDYKGPMGVPITILAKYQNELEILRLLKGTKIDGKEKYARILVKRKCGNCTHCTCTEPRQIRSM